VEKNKNKKVKTDMLRNIGKQSRESVESVLKKKKKATVGMIYVRREYVFAVHQPSLVSLQPIKSPIKS